jgi:hypothetical protein
MRHVLLFVVLMSGLSVLHGCSPTFNWRDVRPDQTPLVALFPCKPDQGVRVVSMGAKDVTLTLLACNVGDATFALAYADMTDAAITGTALGQWKSATLATMRAQSSSERAFVIRGANVLPQSVQLEARGVRADGTAVAAQVVWFAVGSKVFQAAVYANTVSPAVTETFFSGLKVL